MNTSDTGEMMGITAADVKKLKNACKGEKVIIATDPDREGYAIGMMAYEEIKSQAKEIFRAEIREITDLGIKASLAAAAPFAKTNKGLYEAFLGRRVGDRIVGYTLSPLVCSALKGSYSVGRVQSPALRLVVEAERKIRAFVATPYWIPAITLRKGSATFTAFSTKGRFDVASEAEFIIAAVSSARSAELRALEKKNRKANPRPPFTTVDLQAAASANLGIAPERTMKLTQELFEGGNAKEGFITYHRTDSVSIADDFIAQIRSFLSKSDQKLVPTQPVKHKSKNSQAEAHEGIRPTHLHSIADIPRLMREASLSEEHGKLYELIVRRTLTSQCVPAEFEDTTATLICAGHEFAAKGKVLLVPGWLSVYDYQSQGADDDSQALPPLVQGEVLEKIGQEAIQRMTKAPPRYSEATLVKELEKLGIGRPSTYASIIATLKKRNYLEVKGKQIHATAEGEKVFDWLAANHPWVMEFDLTARMEEYLDKVEAKDPGAGWQKFVKGVHARTGYAVPPQRGERKADGPPTEKALKYAQSLATKQGVELPAEVSASGKACSEWLDKALGKSGKNEGKKGATRKPAGSSGAKKAPRKKSSNINQGGR